MTARKNTNAEGEYVSLDAPAEQGYPITKSDDTVLSPKPRGVWVGTGGDLALTMIDAAGTGTNVVVMKNVGSGTLQPVRPSKVMAATTAADLVALV